MALIPDQKFSTFQNGGDVIPGDTIVGLRGGINTRFNYTGELPPGYIVPIDQGGTGSDTAAGARTNLGLGTMAVQNANAVAITGGTAAFDSGQVVAAPVNPTDLVNKAYVDGLDAGNVKSVSGTTNRVTSTGGTTPVIDIAATYVGQTSITTLGTVVTGVWNATPIDLSLYVTGNLAVSHLNSGTGATSGTFWRGDGTWAAPAGSGTVNSGLINQVAWYAASGTAVSGLATAASGVLVTSASSVPSISTTLPNGLAMGTPASLTLTNATGLPVGGISATGTPSLSTFLRGDGTWATSATVTPAALTKTDDTNVTLTLGGTPATALLQATSLTLGWTGQLAITRGGTGISAFGTGVQTALGQNVTGSGGMVLQTSPTITTPRIAQINDTNGVAIEVFSTTASAVNYIELGNSATGSYPGFTGTGSDAAVGIVLNVKGAASGASVLIQGVAAANNTLSGYVGELVSSQVLFASATNINTTTGTNLTSISLTAGDWDVWGNVFIAGSGILTASYCGINTTTGTLPDISLVSGWNCLVAAGFSQSALVAPPQRLSLSGTTTIYLVSLVVFGSGTFSQSGYLAARRRR
jgi:hypothetical protein